MTRCLVRSDTTTELTFCARCRASDTATSEYSYPVDTNFSWTCWVLWFLFSPGCNSSLASFFSQGLRIAVAAWIVVGLATWTDYESVAESWSTSCCNSPKGGQAGTYHSISTRLGRHYGFRLVTIIKDEMFSYVNVCFTFLLQNVLMAIQYSFPGLLFSWYIINWSSKSSISLNLQ